RNLGAQVRMRGVQRLLSRREKNGRGLLPTLRSVLFRRDDLLSAASRELTQQSLVDALAAARRAADDVFTRLARRLDGEPGPAPVLRLSDGFLADAVWDEGVGVALDNPPLAFSRRAETSAISRNGSGSTCRRRGRRCVRSMHRRSITPRSVCSGFPPISPSRGTTNRATAPPSRAYSWSWPTHRTAACSCCSRAMRRCAGRRSRCATRSAAGGPCSCRAKASATTCCDASGRQAR